MDGEGGEIEDAALIEGEVVTAKTQGDKIERNLFSDIEMSGSNFSTTKPDSTLNNQQSYKIGRNDPCPCGSGRKYKKCCLR
ncbi:MAG: SEC-C domain-containing protein [Magnetococcales bacterium]|nr:SEC-C domain-containing protein [Magnetococcales bacterium]